jgi:hypothetical protein
MLQKVIYSGFKDRKLYGKVEKVEIRREAYKPHLVMYTMRGIPDYCAGTTEEELKVAGNYFLIIF